MKKNKTTSLVAKAITGAAIGIAAFVLIKTERNHYQKEKVVENKTANEKLFI